MIEEKIKQYSWHDCPLYSIKFDDNLIFDLDYILEWKVIENSNEYQFLIAPALLKFKEVSSLRIDVETEILNGFEIYEIVCLKNKIEMRLQEGIITFCAKDFEQTLVKEPIWVENQYLSEIERTLI